MIYLEYFQFVIPAKLILALLARHPFGGIGEQKSSSFRFTGFTPARE
jgi:hypothetical protein